ncbi:hypothetical protein [Photobacterium kishitanii]|uniref:Uncharacterized protein n=1 Tax=Photobacterium kishitanii TaxID=318456 RepID=A0A2T3KL70_9GAMM|nr:hypothetical protein [Photobacterium kishitanii]PSV00452.1 hypothetical protein C9J27_04790 [Photobacterium kishitanii]
MRDFVNNVAEQYEEDMVALDGFDSAIVGIVYAPEADTHLVTYSVSKMIDVLVSNQDMSIEDAMEYLQYNTLQPLTSSGYPLFLYDEESFW